MLLDLTSDQAFFRETTAKFLADLVPVDEVRRLRDDPDGFDRAYWKRGADLGWTSLLVDEAHGGGSVSGRGIVDLAVIAHEFGWAAAPGPSDDQRRGGGPERHRLAPRGARGPHRRHHHRVVVPHRAPPSDRLATSPSRSGRRRRLVLTGVKVRSSGERRHHLLVTGRTATASPRSSCRPTPPASPSSRWARSTSPGASRSCASTTFACRGRWSASRRRRRAGRAAAPAGARDADAESVGAMQRAFDITVEWAFDRYTFGRPLSSYQALKHRFADMKSWLEGSHAVADAAAAAVQDRRRTPTSWSARRRPTSATTAPSSCRTVCSCTAASASPSSTTSTCSCGGSCSTGRCSGRRRAPPADHRPPRGTARRHERADRGADDTEIEDVEAFRQRARTWIGENLGPAQPGPSGHDRRQPLRRGGARPRRPRPRHPAAAVRRGFAGICVPVATAARA